MRSLRTTLATLALAGVVASGVAACSSDKKDDDTRRTTTTTTASSTTTSTAPSSSTSSSTSSTTTTEGPTTTEGTTTTAPTTVDATTTTTIVVKGGASSPAAAAGSLVAGWSAGNRTAAGTYAEPGAVSQMFALPQGSARIAGACQLDGDTYGCPYRTGTTTFYVRVQGSDSRGYRVVEVVVPTE